MGLIPFKNNRAVSPPAPIDPVTQRQYDQPGRSQQDWDELAAGQLALTTIETPNQRRARLGLEPIHESQWH